METYKKMSTIDEMFKAGVCYGYSKSRRHPSTAPYIFGTKNGVDIINIEKTEELLKKASEVISQFAQSGKSILFVGTKAEAKQQVVEIALSLNMPYVSERWVGGILTNFSEIKKRVQKLLDLRDQKEKGELDKYTKKEKILINKEMEDMTKNFQGITGISKLPDVLLIIDPKKEHLALEEAKKMNLPVIALLNTDCNLKNIDHPVVANDASVSSITFFLTKIKEAYVSGINGAQK
jgi:small subunit ribosomal protein S2